MNVKVAQDGAVQVEPPTSKPGDFIELRADMDMVCGLTACSAEMSNNGAFKPMQLTPSATGTSALADPAFASARGVCRAAPTASFRVGWADSQQEVREAQRRRFRIFATEMGASLPPGSRPAHDTDSFDPFCEHLPVRAEGHERHGEVIATCRVLSPAAAQRAGSRYIDHEFDLEPVRGLLPRALEMGRVCVNPAWRNGLVVMALWRELGDCMAPPRPGHPDRLRQCQPCGWR